MPVISCHCFANHRGGVGKTTLTYQVSTAYAVAHPDCNVLILDTTDNGDVSEMLMGGGYEKRGREILRKLIPVANVTQLFLRALVASTNTTLAEVLKAHEVSQNEDDDGDKNDQILNSVLAKMPLASKDKTSLEKLKSAMTIDIEECSIPLKDVNHRLPPNMFLCPSGIELEQSIAFSETQRQDIISVLLDSLQNTPGQWKVFIDTDAGPHGENGIYATIGLGIADFLLVPLHADMSDWYGAQVLLHDLQTLHDVGASNAQVHLILWNGLNVKFKQSSGEVTKSGRSKGGFVPTKAEQDICMTLGNLVYREADRFPELFALSGSKITAEKFSEESCCCIRSFGVIGVASKDVGVPIACLKHGVFHGVHMTYNLNNDIIQHSRENLEELVKAIEEADDGMNPSKRCKEHLEFLKARQMNRRLGVSLSKKKQLKPKYSSSSSAKKRSASSSDKRSEGMSATFHKIYALRNKYSLRDRSKKMRSRLFLDFDTGSASTISNMA